MEKNLLVPVEQALVPFYGDKILAVRLPDGQIAASLNSLCKMLKLARQGQMQRIRRDKDLTEYLLFALVQTPGGPQRVEVLVVEAIPAWVGGIQERLVDAEKRPLIHNLKIELIIVLYHHFYAKEAAQPKPESQLDPPIQTIHQKANPAPDSLWDRLFDVLYEMRQKDEARDEQFTQYRRAVDERFSVAEEWLHSLDRHVASRDQGRTGPITLPLLCRAIFSMLERSTGRTQKQLEQEMLEAFRVSAINAIPDELWEDVLAWGFWRARQSD